MAKALVTEEAVFAAADALLADDQQPSIIAVQERIGGGSYSTVKRYLDAWKAQRQAVEQQAADLPQEIATHGSAFIGSLWARAATLAEQRLAQAREEAQRPLAEARTALGAAGRRSPTWRPRARYRPSSSLS